MNTGNISRRSFLLATGAAAGIAGLGSATTQTPPIDTLRVRQTGYAFGRPRTEGLFSLRDSAPPPVLRMRQGEVYAADLVNDAPGYTTMHWHGLRIPNDMDGVPYLTQFPVSEGETFAYRFTPPDAGTYWYHPHCMTLEQMAYGLTGIIVVDEAEKPEFDADIPLNLKDFRLNEDGTLLPYFKPRNAARGGTLGNVLTVNWQQNPLTDVPAGGLVRLRLAATDTTRVYQLSVSGAQGKVIAWDGHPVREEVPWPDAQNPLVLGPGQRADLAVLIPQQEEAEVALTARVFQQERTLARLRAVGPSLKRTLEDTPILAPNPLEMPDISNAQPHELIFGWTPDGNAPNDGACGTLGYTFWSINRTPWAGDAAKGTAPLLDLKMGRSYLLRLRNESPNLHPIHLHGLVMLPLRSNKGPTPRNWTDTILLAKDEIVDVAVKANNPGDWAFHCHVIEHQKTGLAGVVRVS